MKPILRLLGPIGLLAIAACSGPGIEYQYPEPRPRSRADGSPNYDTGPRQTVFGDGGLFGGNIMGSKSPDGGGTGLGVNSFLWRATLDTLAFMPLASADPFGGVIITDWYAPSETPNERFKMTIYILDRQLRADGLKVAAFRQIRSGDQWADASVAPETTANLENAILRRARQLRSDIAQQ